MRDWFMILTPAALLFYLVAYPEKGHQVMQWIEGLLR